MKQRVKRVSISEDLVNDIQNLQRRINNNYGKRVSFTKASKIYPRRGKMSLKELLKECGL